LSKECVSPPELDDKHLLIYLDGEADRETAFHLQRCLYCRERAEALDRFQKSLTSRVYRATCPPPVELGQYHLRMLRAPQMLIVAQHVRECPHCAREVAQLEGFLSDLTPQPGLFEPVKVLIARLFSGTEPGQGSDGSLLDPAFAGLRGEGEEPFIYQAENVRIVIEVQDDVEQMGLKTLLGLVTGLEKNEFTIQVSQGDEVIAATSVDEIGNFIISHLSPGHYKLILSGPNMEIHVQSLPV